MAGNFKKHSTGWEYRYKYVDPITHKKKEKSQRGFKTKAEAAKALNDFIKLLESGIEISDMYLSDFLDSWFKEYVQGTVRKNTLALHENNINKHIKPYFKRAYLKDVKPIMYQKFINHLTASGYSKRTVEIVHSTMYSAMEKAILLGKLEKNPCKGITIKSTDKKEKGVKFVESENVPTLLKAAYQYGYIYWIFFKFLIETGTRKGEAAALQWTDIDLKNRTVTINKSLDFQYKIESEMFGDTKTKNSPRTIKLSQSTVNDLKEHIKHQNRNKLNMNELYRHDLNLVFCKDDGNILPKSSLFNAFQRILKRADLPQVPIHALRHTHAVIMLEAGADMKYLQERLGHGSIQITSDVYSHVSKKIESRNMTKFEDRISDIYVK